MAPQSHDRTAADPSEIAERLLAHARLCRQVAEVTGSEDVAALLGQLAEDCVRAAAAVTAEDGVAYSGKVH